MKQIFFALLLLFPAFIHAQSSKPDLSKMKIEVVQVQPQNVLTIRDTCTLENIGPTLGMLYGEIGKYMKEQGLEMAGPVFAIYRNSDPKNMILEAGVAANKTSAGNNRVKAWEMKGGNAVKASYYGSYDGLRDAYPVIGEWMKKQGVKQTGSPWESYVTDPTTVKDMNECLTEIYFPVQ